MSLHITGECLGVSRAERGRPGEKFTVTTVHIVDRSDNGVHTHEVPIVRDFRGTLPEPGEHIALDVFIARWKTGGGFDLKATGRNAVLESALYAPAGK